MRPTWHYVLPADIRWILKLTSPRVQQLCGTYYRKRDLDAATLARGADIIGRALDGGRHLTKQQLTVELERAGYPTADLRDAFTISYAELEGIICSGPRPGRQHTYALLDEWVPPAPARPREEALAELTRRYFQSHGPAEPRDFAWWSGLTVKDAELGLEAAKPKLHKETIDGHDYWGASSSRASAPAKGCTALLLPNYDEYLIAYKDRGAVVDSARAANIVARSNGAFPHHLAIDGRLSGSWRRTIQGTSVLVEVAPYNKLTPVQSRAVMSAADCYGEFLGLPMSLSIV
jgi:hypothetical protein